MLRVEQRKMIKYIKKSLLLLTGVTTVVSSTPKLVFAEGEIPDEAFITKEKLLEICEKTNAGGGLLATGDAGLDKKIRISFGCRDLDFDFRYYNSIPEGGCAGGVARTQQGGINWLVAGKEGAAGEEVVLYSEEPLGLCSLKKTSVEFEKVGVKYPEGCIPKEFAASHWGCSELRGCLTILANTDSKFFRSLHRDLMLKSNIKTMDFKNECEYTTEDILYAPSLAKDKTDCITVGERDNLEINREYWGGIHWLRSQMPYEDYRGYITSPKDQVLSCMVDSTQIAATAAFKLNLRPVLFASTAPHNTMGYREITEESPLELRLDGSGKKFGECKVTGDKKRIEIKNIREPHNLVIQGVKADGTIWSYQKEVTVVMHSDWTLCLYAQEVAEKANIQLQDFRNCEVWLERQYNNKLYAIRATIDDAEASQEVAVKQIDDEEREGEKPTKMPAKKRARLEDLYGGLR